MPNCKYSPIADDMMRFKCKTIARPEFDIWLDDLTQLLEIMGKKHVFNHCTK